MALGDPYGSGDLDALHADRNRSETTICLPSPSPAKRASTYLPQAGPKVLEESNTDPFYLEQSLAATPVWESDSYYHPTIRDDQFSEDHSQYYTLSLTNEKSTPGPDRSTLVQLERENDLRFHRYTSSSEDNQRRLHSSQHSFSSVQTDSSTPDLTPSSSFSSTYSSPACPDAVLQATQKLYQHAQRAKSEPRRAFYLPPSTPPKHSLPPPPPVPSLPRAQTRPTTPVSEPSNDSTTTYTMKYETSSMSSSSRRRKPHPTLPNLSRGTSTHSSRRKQSSPGTRPPLDPSMISPPSLINPVTMEPHATHFDQALFIPANECPSPIPSPSASSPPISRQWTATSLERPSTSTMDAYCEQSVWESDSDNESIGHKSLSRKPIDTLRKVRSRAKLRAAKSQPKLHQAMLDDELPEKFPCMPEDAMGQPIPDLYRGASLDRPSTSRDGLRPRPLQTLRLVAPSTTSLLKPRSRNNSTVPEADIDRSTAAAIQARSRRRQRSDSPEYVNHDKEKLTSMCYEQQSQGTLPEVEPDSRPFFRRVLDSLRALNCHKASTKTSPTTI
ncbi:hypothetical protein N7462_001722 [Penicillium macrosclerotiorum]|uniref:uncharacterized protein n=1 Tax=Penicillium macrosclerotiorum TaxID=303699 RepID=UPI0025482D8E|nr:uncharacterized protein N7462_001722 [Penicillium macrosclerotiorum]KAJ5692299.1 hypothetical protein N7462_001722 [Penicillium macrosclerotiorum]